MSLKSGLVFWKQRNVLKVELAIKQMIKLRNINTVKKKKKTRVLPSAENRENVCTHTVRKLKKYTFLRSYMLIPQMIIFAGEIS